MQEVSDPRRNPSLCHLGCDRTRRIGRPRRPNNQRHTRSQSQLQLKRGSASETSEMSVMRVHDGPTHRNEQSDEGRPTKGFILFVLVAQGLAHEAFLRAVFSKSYK